MKYLLRDGRHNNPNPYYVLSAAIFIVIILMNIYLVNVITKDKELPVELANSSGPSMTEPLPENLLPLDKVRGLASTDAPNNEITSVNLEQRSGQLVYLVTLASGRTLTFNAQSGQRLGDTTLDNMPRKSENVLPTSIDATVDFEMAREIAKSDKPDGQIEKIELGQESDAVIYSVFFTDNIRIDISGDGTILRRESLAPPEPPVETPTDTPPVEEQSQQSGNVDLAPMVENPSSIEVD